MLHSFLCDEKFSQSLTDPCVYVRNSETDGCIIIIAWVDDIIIAEPAGKARQRSSIVKEIWGALFWDYSGYSCSGLGITEYTEFQFPKERFFWKRNTHGRGDLRTTMSAHARATG